MGRDWQECVAQNAGFSSGHVSFEYIFDLQVKMFGRQSHTKILVWKSRKRSGLETHTWETSA